MGLARVARLLLQSAQFLQVVVRTARCEPGRDDGRDEVVVRIDGFDVLDGFSTGFDPGLGAFLPIPFRTQIRVHAYAADEGALALCLAQICEEVCGGHVDGGVVGCCCCAVGEGAGDGAVVDVICPREVLEGGFEGEGVGV